MPYAFITLHFMLVATCAFACPVDVSETPAGLTVEILDHDSEVLCTQPKSGNLELCTNV